MNLSINVCSVLSKLCDTLGHKKSHTNQSLISTFNRIGTNTGIDVEQSKKSQCSYSAVEKVHTKECETKALAGDDTKQRLSLIAYRPRTLKIVAVVMLLAVMTFSAIACTCVIGEPSASVEDYDILMTHYIRTGNIPSESDSSALLISSRGQLDEYRSMYEASCELNLAELTEEMSFSKATASYDDNFFSQNSLVLLRFEESSATNRHKVISVARKSADEVSVAVNRLILPNGMESDASIGCWHVIVELASECINSSDKINVELSTLHSLEVLDEYARFFDIGILDIDGDGTLEQYAIGFGRTSGLFTFVIRAMEVGKSELKYFNTYNASWSGSIKFIETTGGAVKLKVLGSEADGEDAAHIYDVTIKDGNIVLSENGKELEYWGQQIR